MKFVRSRNFPDAKVMKKNQQHALQHLRSNRTDFVLCDPDLHFQSQKFKNINFFQTLRDSVNCEGDVYRL